MKHLRKNTWEKLLFHSIYVLRHLWTMYHYYDERFPYVNLVFTTGVTMCRWVTFTTRVTMCRWVTKKSVHFGLQSRRPQQNLINQLALIKLSNRISPNPNASIIHLYQNIVYAALNIMGSRRVYYTVRGTKQPSE